MTIVCEDRILYLSRKETEQICATLDSVAVIREMFRLHATRQTRLPEEAYLGWTNQMGETVRNLNMPGYVGGLFKSAGTKIINGNIANPKRGLPRASGLTLLYDDTTVRVQCIMESAYISSLRTASVTALAAELCQGPEIQTLALIGAGELARAHSVLLVKRLASLKEILLFDVNPARCYVLEQEIRPLLASHNVAFRVMASAQEAIEAAQLIVPATTTTEGYIRYAWLQPGAILVNISLDDVLPEVVFQAQKVIVDDWQLVKDDPRRLLGRMYRAKLLLGPGEYALTYATPCRYIDAQLGEIVTGAKKGRDTLNDVILVNPFGLAIEDVALAACVYQAAREQRIGVWLER